ncbi:MAG: FxsA family protein [Halomonadaceae bacterium]|nr:MAG: FxsA family protein [Halomonadaceae bacterium]
MPIFLIAFVIFPIVEMVVLIQVGGMIGALNTVGLVLLTAVIGAALLKHQGLATLTRANQRMASGEMPAREVAEGLLLAVGGALLLTPGFITDGVGFLCLLPGTRHWLAGKLMQRMVVGGSSTFVFGQGGPRPGGDPFGGRDPFAGQGPFGTRPGSGPQRDARGNVIIDGDFEREDDSKDTSGSDSRGQNTLDSPDDHRPR